VHTFEALVAHLAAQFVIVEADEAKDVFVDSLRQISESFDFDESTLWCIPANPDDAVVAHGWKRNADAGTRTDGSASAMPGLLSRLRNGEVVTFSHPDQLPAGVDRDSVRRIGIASSAALPFFAHGALKAAVSFSTRHVRREWSSDLVDRLRIITAVFGQTLLRLETEHRLRGALAELRQLRDDLAIENVQRRRANTMSGGRDSIVAESPATWRVIEQIESVAPTGATVLLLGETGCGKEVFARAIHRASSRHHRPMVTVNCAALPPTLIESELFGRERGAYTGALARQIGRFEMAHGSTIFLDEIGELPLDSQAKLLRVIQERVIERLGGGHSVNVDVRIIAATNRNLEKAVEEHTFREDLFYRLNVFPIVVPPLRERTEDIPALAWAFIDEYANAFHRPIDSIAKDSLAALKQYTWPGNVRELRNVIERAMIVAKSSMLVVDIPGDPATAALKSMRLDDVQSQQITQVLDRVGWRVRGPGGAAEILGINPNTLDSRMAKLGIRRPPRHTPRVS
jgi:formate hydrogenlyase transcriptional activator